MKRFALALWLFGGCASSVEDDFSTIRAERIELEERLSLAENAPLWVTEGEYAFDRFIQDDDSAIPSFMYDHLVRKLADRSAIEIRAATEEGFDWDRCLDSPASFRGRFWRVTGTIARIWVERIASADLPVRHVYAGVFYPRGGAPVFFHVLEKPDVLELHSDTVEIDGLFLKVIRTPTTNGRDVVAPFFLAKTMRRLM